MKFKLRDLIAVPFLFLALLIEGIALMIGSAWTSAFYLKNLQSILFKDKL